MDASKLKKKRIKEKEKKKKKEKVRTGHMCTIHIGILVSSH